MADSSSSSSSRSRLRSVSPKARLRRSSVCGGDPTRSKQGNAGATPALEKTPSPGTGRGAGGGQQGKWSLRRFSHDSAASTSSGFASVESVTPTSKEQKSPVLQCSANKAAEKTPETNSANNVKRAATRTLSGSSSASRSSSSQDPIKIITDYGIIPAPLTPSPSVKSPRASPRGTQNPLPNDICSVVKILLPVSREAFSKPCSKFGKSEKGALSSASPKEESPPGHEGESREKTRTIKAPDSACTFPMDSVSGRGGGGHGRGKKPNDSKRLSPPHPGSADSTVSRRGRGRGGGSLHKMGGRGGGRSRSSDIMSVVNDSREMESETQSSQSDSSIAPKKRKTKSEQDRPSMSTSPRPTDKRTSSPDTPARVSVDSSNAKDESMSSESGSSGRWKKPGVLTQRKTYPSRNRQQRVPSPLSPSMVYRKSSFSSVHSPTTSAPGKQDSSISTPSTLSIETNDGLIRQEHSPVILSVPKLLLTAKPRRGRPPLALAKKRGRPPLSKTLLKLTKKPGLNPRPRGRPKAIKNSQNKSANEAANMLVQHSQTNSKKCLLVNLENSSSESDLQNGTLPITDLREKLNRKRQLQAEQAKRGPDRISGAAVNFGPSSAPLKSSITSSSKTKKSNLTLEMAKKLKTAAKRRVKLQIPPEKLRAKSSRFSPRSPRKSPRIILKDVIRLSKIEYDMSLARADSSDGEPQNARPPASKRLKLDPEDSDSPATVTPVESGDSKVNVLILVGGNQSSSVKMEKSTPQSSTVNRKVKEHIAAKKDKKSDAGKQSASGKTKSNAVSNKKGSKLKGKETLQGGRSKRPLTPDTSDDDVLYSINPDYDGDDSDSDLSLSTPKKKQEGSKKTLTQHSPRKLLLKDSIKPKPKTMVKPGSKDGGDAGSPPSNQQQTQQTDVLKTPPTSPLHGSKARPTSPLAFQPVIHPSILNSPSNDAYKNLLRKLPNSLQSQRAPKRGSKVSDSGGEDDMAAERRVSVRNSESAFRYKEIIVKKCPGYTQMWLFTTTKTKNALNPKVMQELAQALHNAKFDDSRLVLLSGSGSIFCSGLDLNYLLNGDRRQSAQTMAEALREFVRVLVNFPKPIVAAVNGPAIGLGAAILPLCDIIYASDKASFFSPYGRLLQTPEGCSSLTFPQVMGMAMANELLLGGRKLTAIEAYQIGLVSQVFWPTSMMQEVIPRIQNMATQSIRSLEASKLLIRSHQRAKLELTNESECRMLVERWSSLESQKAMRAYLDEELDYLM